MKVIPREAGRVTYSTEIRRLKLLEFNSNQKALIIGSILGDGCLSANWSRTNYRLSIVHSKKQKEYIEWKHSALGDFILSKPRYYERTDSLIIRTISHSYLSDLHKIFYPDGKKIIPKNIEKYITNPLTIAVWYMDDGNIRKDNGKIYGYYLNTQAFNYSNNEILANALEHNFGIKSLILKNKGYYRLYIGRDRNKFARLICGSIIPSMSYKIS